jgi:hypothetical protein
MQRGRSPHGFWDPAKEDAANLAWVERLFADMQPFNTGEVYVNSLDEGEEHRVREAYAINYGLQRKKLVGSNLALSVRQPVSPRNLGFGPT